MMRHGLFLLLLAGFAGIGSAVAQVPDPTRPPDGVMTPESSGGVIVPTESGVQAVIVRSKGKGKSSAVINGQYVEVGDKLGDKKVLKITESEVVLQGEGEREIMKATPDIEKVPARKQAAAKRRTTGTTEK
jgi:MSHA biogenesis protein MshK